MEDKEKRVEEILRIKQEQRQIRKDNPSRVIERIEELKQNK